MGRRHRWNDKDVCKDCGLRRSGCSARRTGSMSYYDRWGEFAGHVAGTCVPIIPSPTTLGERSVR